MDKNKKHKWTQTEDDVLNKAVESCTAFLSECEIESGKRTEAWWSRVSGCICLMTDGNHLVTAKAARARWRRLSRAEAPPKTQESDRLETLLFFAASAFPDSVVNHAPNGQVIINTGIFKTDNGLYISNKGGE